MLASESANYDELPRLALVLNDSVTRQRVTFVGSGSQMYEPDPALGAAIPEAVQAELEACAGRVHNGRV